jgi:hypothetical protein
MQAARGLFSTERSSKGKLPASMLANGRLREPLLAGGTPAGEAIRRAWCRVVSQDPLAV